MRESPEVNVPDGPADAAEVGWLRGLTTLGAAASSERCSVVMLHHQELPVGECSRPTVGLGAPSPCRMGEGQRRRGRNRTRAPGGLPGVGAAAPSEGSMCKAGKVCVPANTRPHGKDPAYSQVAGRGADWRMRPYERRRDGQHNLPRAKGLWASVAVTGTPDPGVVPLGAIPRPDPRVVRVVAPGAAKAVCQLECGQSGGRGGSVRPPRGRRRGMPSLTCARSLPAGPWENPMSG